jgi:glycosyltransferase involved in cell wall biosynthesis
MLEATDTGRPTVSVIIPAYNEGPLLAEAIESALAQTYSPTEVIVVDDGSTDPRTAETVLSYGSRVRLITRENGGVAAARQTGIDAARGSLIALLDQDDRWLPHKLEAQVRDLERHPRATLAHSSYYTIDESGTRTGVVKLQGREYSPLPGLLMEVPIASGTCVMRREVIEAAGGFDPALPGTDDWDLWLRMAARGGTFVCNREPLAEYRVHGANTSRNLNLMVRSTFGTLRKFYSLPDLSASARRIRPRAYAHRHAWAAANLYATGERERAKWHLQRAAHLHPQTVTSLRFLRTLIQNQQGISPNAENDTVKTLMNLFPPSTDREKAYRRNKIKLAHALSTGATHVRVINALTILLSSPSIWRERELWSEALGSVIRRIRR